MRRLKNWVVDVVLFGNLAIDFWTLCTLSNVLFVIAIVTFVLSAYVLIKHTRMEDYCRD